MKASLKRIVFDGQTPFRCSYSDLPNYNHKLHYHDNGLELTLILEGSGTRFVADNVADFHSGDLVLLGPNLPHLWLNMKKSFDKNETFYRRATLHFSKDFIDKVFSESMELMPLINLFKMSKRGIGFSKKTSRIIKPLLFHICNIRGGLRKWSVIFDIFYHLSEANSFDLLGSPGYCLHNDISNNQVFDKIFQYVENNKEKKITLKEIAEMAFLTKSSFCRFFKQKTGKPFFVFLNEFRINHARKLLIEDNDLQISEIAIRSGFPSVQYFNSKFKEYNKGLTPLQYLKEKKLNPFSK